MVLEDNGRWTFSSANEEIPNAIICEVIGNPADPVPCPISNNLIISLESSTSMEPMEFAIAKEQFVLPLALMWNQWAETVLSFMVYSDAVWLQFDLSRKLSDMEIENGIQNAPHLRGSTASHLALESALREFQNRDRSSVKNLLFITVSPSTNPELTAAAARRLHDAGVNVYALGIGGRVNQAELLAIAGGNVRRVFSASNFAELRNVLKPMLSLGCD